MAELLAQVVAAHRVRAEAAGIRLRTRADPGPGWTPTRCGCARRWAIWSPTRSGTPRRTARSRSPPADRRLVVITVADTGAGIAPEDLPHVFERFWRAEKSRSRRTGGSGLGLSIVRQLVEAHGGTVTADSEPGAGAVFTLRLPRATEPERLSP